MTAEQMTRADADTVRSLSASDWWSLVRFAHIFSSAVREILEQQLFHEVSGNGLTLSQFHLLEFIALGDKRHQMLDVAAFLGVSTAAATKNVDKLQRLGLVNRKPFPGDRRVTLLSLSRKGRRVVEQYAEVEQKKLATVLHRFRSAELTTLARLLERCSIELVRAGGDAHAVCLRCAGHFDEECSIRHLHAGCPYQNVIARRSRLE